MNFLNKKTRLKIMAQALIATSVFGLGIGYSLTFNENNSFNINVSALDTSVGVSQVICGGAHTIFIKNDGTVWATGYNTQGNLGIGNVTNQSSPVQVLITDVKNVICGGNHTIFIKNDGTVWGTGNTYGQLGVGNATPQNAPVQIPITDVKNVICGSAHTIFIKNDGTVWATGYNYYGQLGIGNTTNQSSPVKVPITDVKNVICGSAHTIFIKNDGTVWATGQNAYGQLGVGNDTNQSKPVQISITDVKNVICGGSHTIFIKNDGTVWGSGYSGYGQLGTGNTTSQFSPVRISITDVKTVVCGNSHTIFIKNDGTVWGTGNTYGQLGIGTKTGQLSPVKIPITNVKEAICGGSNDTIFIKNDGTAWGTGLNDYGQLGIGTMTTQTSPVQISINWLFNDYLIDTTTKVTNAETSKTQANVDLAQTSINLLPNGDSNRTALQTRLDVVKSYIAYQAQLATATNSVTKAEGSKLQADVDSAKTLVNALTNTTDKTNLTNRLIVVQTAIDKAKQDALNLADATTKVTTTETTKTQANVDLAQTAINLLPTGTDKTNLQTRLDVVKSYITNATTATQAVAKAEASKLQADVDSARALVNALPNGTDKTTLQGRVDIAQLTVDTTAPDAPIITGDVKTLNNGKISVSITYPSDATVREYKLNNGNWTSYSSPILAGDQDTIYARCSDSAGNISAISSLVIFNVMPPIITIGTYNTNTTNQNIVVNATVDKGTLNATTHTFTENGEFTFTATDSYGNVTSKTVTITNINKTAPIVTINPYSTEVTNKDVTVTATTDKGTLNTGSHVFTDNGSFTFTATDAYGNTSSKTVTITNIDKIAPIITIAPYNTNPTNQSVMVSATVNDGTLNTTSHTFTENGEFTFTATDSLGNTSTKTVTIANIGKVPPVITIGTYNTNPTNQDVIVTATTDKGNLNAITHTFTENGSYTFTAIDVNGNASSKTVTINNIDKTAPVITIAPYNTNPTNQNITVTASVDKGTLNQNSYTFSGNGSFTFTATNSFGNTSTKIVTIDNIDKIAPTTPTLTEDVTTPTTKDVNIAIAYPTDAKDKLYKIGVDSSWTSYTTPVVLTHNATVYAKCIDEAGNSSAEANLGITNVNKNAPVITINEYNTNPTNQNITVTATTDSGTLNQNSYTFTQNGEFTFIATNEAGTTTSKTVTIANIDKSLPIITLGAYVTNADGSVTVTATTNKGTLNQDSYTFIKNGDFTFTATDGLGNVGTKTSIVNSISTIVIPGVPVDTTAPIITIAPYNKNKTGLDITVNATTNEGILNVASHTFTENGNFTFTATDESGNVGTKTVTIDNIDKNLPVITINDYNTNKTNQNITVNATTNKGTLNQSSYIFTENGEFTFIATDDAGKTASKKVTINNINKVAPVITIATYSTEVTNKSIVVTATTDKGTLNQGSYTFTKNGSFEFIATDEYGNTSNKTITINNINTSQPVITTTIGTYDKVAKTLVINATTNKGTLNATSYKFTADGSYDFIAIDELGNKTTKTATVVGLAFGTPEVTTHDKDENIKPITFEQDIKEPTNKKVTVTINYPAYEVTKQYKIGDGEWIDYTTPIVLSENAIVYAKATDVNNVLNEGSLIITNINTTAPVITIADYNTKPTNKPITVTATTDKGTLNETSHTFTENGEFVFTATDELGNVGIKKVTITNIVKDTTAPIITISAYDIKPTNKPITVTATTDKGTLNTNTHTFTENGEFVFTATDELGNVGTKKVTITNIVNDTTVPVITISAYDTKKTNKPITVTATTDKGTLNTNTHTFTENGEFVFTATDELGNIGTKTVTITNIVNDTTAPVITISAYDTKKTNKPITVTATTDKGILNTNTHTFTENGSFTFTATDELGNIGTKIVTITNIDKTAPIITIADYDINPRVSGLMITATTDKGTLNTTSHLFTENGSFVFKATDEAGNVGTKTVTITNIAVLDYKDAEAKVKLAEAFVTNNTVNDKIATAQTAIDKLPNCVEKTSLQNRLNKVKEKIIINAQASLISRAKVLVGQAELMKKEPYFTKAWEVVNQLLPSSTKTSYMDTLKALGSNLEIK